MLRQIFIALIALFHIGAADAASVITPPVTVTQTIGAKLRAGYLANRFANPHASNSSIGPQVMASPPTVSISGAHDATLTKSYNWSSAPQNFLLTGGDAVNYASTARLGVTTLTNGGANGNISNGRNGVAWRVQVFIDSARFEARFLGSQNVRVNIDGKYVSASGTTLNQGGTNNYIVVDFSGARARRKVILEADSSSGFYGISVGPTETVTPVPAGLKMIVLGDSITAATASGVAVPSLADGFAMALCDSFGVVDCRMSGSGGEGILNPANAGAGYTLGQRLQWDALIGGATCADVYAITMGTNDTLQTASALTTEMLADIRWLRARCPAAPVFVFGAPGNASGPSASVLTVENAYSAAVTAAADAMVLFVPVSSAPQPMLFGTGRYGSTNSSGNSDLYVGSDGTHWTAGGHVYAGTWMADAMYAASQALP